MSDRGTVALEGPVPLTSQHSCDSFDFGKANLNTWLQTFADSNQRAEYTQTYVLARRGAVVGYYALAAGSVEPASAPTRVGSGLPQYQPVLVVILARLAVDVREQGNGLGAALLKDALLRFLAAADIIGARALLVDAQDRDARQFYERFEFEPSPIDPLQMFLLTKDIRRTVASN